MMQNKILNWPITSATILELTFYPDEKIPDGMIEIKTDQIYYISLKEQTCTCSDFKSRINNPKNDLSRCCRHLLSEFRKYDAFSLSTKWVKAMADTIYGGPKYGWVVKLENSPSVVVAKDSSDEWLLVYAHAIRVGENISNASGKIKQYSWSILKKRWSYGEYPPGARELKTLLAEISIK